MALVNQAMHEINAKIVYFGPGLAGKASNLRYIHGKLKPEFRGKLKAMEVSGGKMLFFDFTPPGEGQVQGYRVRIHLYTISGERVDPAAWKVALKGADGLVFVADAASDRVVQNSHSLEELEAGLASYGMTLCSKPMVFQYNKCDRDDALSKEDLDRVLNPSGLNSFYASSETGTGVLETLLSLVKTVLLELREKGSLEEIAGEATASVAASPVLEPAPPPSFTPAESVGGFPAYEAPEPPAFTPVPEAPPVAAPPAQGTKAAADEPLSLELSADVEFLGTGRLSLPVTIRSGSRSKSVTLKLTFSLDQG